MKKHLKAILLFLFIVSFSFGQKPLLDNFSTGDTLIIHLVRMADLLGPYDGDTLHLVKTSGSLMLHSGKTNSWYKLDEAAFKNLRSMEKRGLKGTDQGLLHVDLFHFRLQKRAESFSLRPVLYAEFMSRLKAIDTGNSARQLD